MKHFPKFRAASVLAILFLIGIFFIGFAALPDFLINTIAISEEEIPLSKYIQNVNEQYESMLPTYGAKNLLQNNATYINFNGYMAKLMGQKLLNERLLLNNGHLTWLLDIDPSDEEIHSVAENIADLCRYQTEKGKHFLFVLAPGQISKYEDLIPEGFAGCDTSNITSDRLLEQFDELGVPYLDLREALYQDGLSHSDAFFVTDHHWKPETGFWAFGRVLKELEAMGAISPVQEKYISSENYNFTTYEKFFLGSAGKRTGVYYGGVDDFCVITPKFDTYITVEIPRTDEYYEGPYEQSTNDPFWKNYFEEPDYFNKFPYDIYGRSDTYPVLRLNEDAPQDGKFMLIGDSFNNVPFSFFSIYTKNSIELDMRPFDEDFPSLINNYDPDTVIMLVNVGGCMDTNVTYPFFRE